MTDLVAPLQIYLLTQHQDILDAASARLASDRYVLHHADLLTAVPGEANPNDAMAMDCLVVEAALLLDPIQQRLTVAGVLVPTVVLLEDDLPSAERKTLLADLARVYHSGIVSLPQSSLANLEGAIHDAIQKFLTLSAESCALPPAPLSNEQIPVPVLLSAQQERLTDKLKARLGYLGVYYKRTPDHFLRNMSQSERDTLLRQLRNDYRRIVLSYFANDSKLNQNIDAFVTQAFMADISVSYIVEIHMDLMDEFSKQLKLEGRSEEILLDYRLTLIDVIAHLCEMYRRSVPRQP